MAAEPIAATEPTGVTTPARTLTTGTIIVLIVAAITPLSIVVGTLPLGLAFGGPSTTLAFVIAGAIIWLFCIGYVQMVRRITRPGAFYNYIARGLGRPMGVGAAMIAVVGYPAGLIGAFAVQSFVAQETIAALFGVVLPWQLLLVAQSAIVGSLAYRRIDLNARAVVLVVGAEVLLILVLVGAIVLDLGFAAFPMGAFSLDVFGVGQWAVAFVFAILCFQGYEAGALYAPEAKRPEKTVPRALYGALVLIVGLLALTSWALTGVTGIEDQQQIVLDAGITGFIFATVEGYLGSVGLWIFSFLALLAQLACALAITNFMGRYLQSLASEDLLPRVLARRNRHDAPGAAVAALVGVALVVILGLSALGIDPYTQISAVGFGIGALGATALQGLASAAVVGYFLKNPAPEQHRWQTLFAPTLAAVLLAAALVVEISAFHWITGSEEPWTAALPWAIPLVLAFGIAYGLWIRKNRPATYRDLAAGDTAEAAERLRTSRLAERGL